MFYKEVRPEKSVGDYIISRRSRAKNLTHLQSPEVNLELQRVKLRNAEERLRLKREDYERKKADFATQWDGIDSIGAGLKQNCHGFNKFVIENLEKRRRAKKLTEDYEKLAKEREDSANKVRLSLDVAKRHLRDLERETSKHGLYEAFLEKVVDTTDQEENFKTVGEVIERYEYYTELGAQFAEKLSQEVKILEGMKADFFKFYETNQTALLALFVQVAGLNGRYEEAFRRTHSLEILVYQIKENCRQRYIDLNLTRSSIGDLYRAMTLRQKRRAGRVSKEADFEQQLLFISRTIRLIHELKKRMAKASTAAPSKKIKT